MVRGRIHILSSQKLRKVLCLGHTERWSLECPMRCSRVMLFLGLPGNSGSSRKPILIF